MDCKNLSIGLISFVSKQSSKIFIFLVFLLFFHGIINYFVLTDSNYPIGGDSPRYYSPAKNMHADLFARKLDIVSFIQRIYFYLFGNGGHRSLYSLILSFFFTFFNDKNSLAMVNMLFYAILIFSTYLIGKRIIGFSEGGILSAVIVSCFPIINAMSRSIMTDFASTSFIVLVFYFLLELTFPRGKRNNFLFAIFTAIVIVLASFIRESFFIFLFTFCIYFFFETNFSEMKRKTKYLLIAVLTGLTISLASYFRTFDIERCYYLFNCITGTSPFLYVKYLPSMLTTFCTILFICSFFFYLFRKQRTFLIIILLPLILFSFSPNKAFRFIMPILPFAAIMISDMLWKCFGRYKIIIFLFSCIIIIQHFLFSYLGYSTFLYKLPVTKFILTLDTNFSFYDWQHGLYSIVDIGNYENDCRKLFDIVKNDIATVNLFKKARLLFFPSKGQDIMSSVKYIESRYSYNIDSHCVAEESFPKKEMIGGSNWDYIVICEDLEYPAKELRVFEQHKKEFSLLKKITMDNTVYCLYKKTNGKSGN